jgi:hypothetical protein
VIELATLIAADVRDFQKNKANLSISVALIRPNGRGQLYPVNTVRKPAHK